MRSYYLLSFACKGHQTEGFKSILLAPSSGTPGHPSGDYAALLVSYVQLSGFLCAAFIPCCAHCSFQIEDLNQPYKVPRIKYQEDLLKVPKSTKKLCCALSTTISLRVSFARLREEYAELSYA